MGCNCGNSYRVRNLNDLALPVGATEGKITGQTDMNVNRDAMRYVTPDKIDWNSAKAEQNKKDKNTSSEVEQLDFEFVLFASAIIDYDYIMALIAEYSQHIVTVIDRHVITADHQDPHQEKSQVFTDPFFIFSIYQHCNGQP